MSERLKPLYEAYLERMALFGCERSAPALGEHSQNDPFAKKTISMIEVIEVMKAPGVCKQAFSLLKACPLKKV